MTKQKSAKYRLVTKALFIERKTKTGYRESTRTLVKGAVLQNGMTEKELDAKLTGKVLVTGRCSVIWIQRLLIRWTNKNEDLLKCLGSRNTS